MKDNLKMINKWKAEVEFQTRQPYNLGDPERVVLITRHNSQTTAIDFYRDMAEKTVAFLLDQFSGLKPRADRYSSVFKDHIPTVTLGNSGNDLKLADRGTFDGKPWAILSMNGNGMDINPHEARALLNFLQLKFPEDNEDRRVKERRGQ